MKIFKKKLTILIGSLVWSGSLYANPQVYIEKAFSEAENAITIYLENKLDSDLYCPNFSVRASFYKPGSRLLSSEKTYSVENLYLEAGDSIVSSFDLSRNMTGQDTNLVLGKFETVGLDRCWTEAKLEQYCEYIQSNSAPETYETASQRHTLRVLMEVSREYTCSDLYDELSTNIKIKDANLSSFKPFQFLTKLKYLYIHGNKIKDLTGAEKLVNLRKIDISDNPIRDIQKVAELPEIRYINASKTDVYETKHIEFGPKLRKGSVILRYTPFARGKKLVKPTRPNIPDKPSDASTINRDYSRAILIPTELKPQVKLCGKPITDMEEHQVRRCLRRTEEIVQTTGSNLATIE